LTGDPQAAKALAGCLKVDPKEKLLYTHGFHAYPARMHPVTARRVLEVFPSKRILDPFVGSGTAALEALRAGAEFVGRDLSPVALEIAWCRTRIWHPDRCRDWERKALAVAAKSYALHDDAEFVLPEWTEEERSWYAPHTLREIAALWTLIGAEQEPEDRRLMMGVLSSVVVRLSKQISDSDVKVDLYHRPRPRHAAFRAFQERIPELTSALLQLSSDLHKRKVALKEPRFELGDARELSPKGWAELVLSSPPYAGTYDYARHQDRRYPLYGFSSKAMDDLEIGARRDAGEGYSKDMIRCLKAIAAACVPDARIVLQVGDGAAGPADRLIPEMAAACGLEVKAIASQRRRAFDGALAKEEHLMLLTARK
jgi:hypothetical protein